MSHSFAPYAPAWDVARLKCQRQPWTHDVLRALRADFDWWRQALAIPASDQSSHRFHTYFCDADGEKLQFDVQRPHEHRCPRCGKVHTGQPWDGAWVMQMHNAAACQAERAVILMQLESGDAAQQARAVFEEILLHYARHYLDYPVHGDRPPMRGRVQPHGLNEAVWLVALLRPLRWSGLLSTFSAVDRAAVETMARAAVDLLQPQLAAIHNHDGWKLAALAECAVLLHDNTLLNWCRDSQFGMETQLRQGFNEDGFWHESSITYHFYMLDAVFSYLEAAGPDAIRDPHSLEKLILAVRNPARLAYRDGRMPAYADGWITTTLGDFAHVAEIAWTRLNRAADVTPYYRGEKPRAVRLVGSGAGPACVTHTAAHRASTAALLYGPEQIEAPTSREETSFVLRDAGIAVLKNDQVRIGLRFGADGGWHDHKDKLNVDIETATGWRSLDLGTSGYDSQFTHWLRSPLAHNLIVVEGQPQPAHTGQLIDFAPDKITAASAYGPTRLQRTVRLTADGWEDEYSVTLDTECRLEWIFHGDGLFTPEGNPPATLEPAADEYRWLQNLQTLITSPRTLVGAWRQGTTGVRLSLVLPEGFSVHWAEAPGNAEGRPLGVVLVRGRARTATFRAQFSLLNS
ncbi:MAG: hypothetical protein B9S32_12890 [Verrucomicrobia bacterium Tous-C9LFEB]|nr:MAG: hypothetical protein B9S32_12890 [Verrucomicrobia bacterium Tous-C9LFEB]